MNVDTILQMCEIKSDEKVLGKNLALKLETYHQQLSTIAEFAPHYDSKTGVKANGFRTFVKVPCLPALPLQCKLLSCEMRTDSFIIVSIFP